MANSFLSWWHGLSWWFFKPIVHNHKPSDDVTSLILELAVTTDVDATLRNALTNWQVIIKETLNGDLYIVSPSSRKEHTQLLHANQLNPSPSLLQKVRYQLTHHAADRPAPLSNSPMHVQKIPCQNTKQKLSSNAWLIVCFDQATPSKEKIDACLQPLAIALEKGLTIWQQHQVSIEHAIDKTQTSHAAELHDTLAQTLSYLRIKSCQLADLCDEQTNPTAKTISDDIATQVKLAYRQSRDLIATSRLNLQTGQLIPSILIAVEEFEQRSSIVFEVDNRVSHHTHTAADIQVLYIIREALSNVVRHSDASHARLKITQSPQNDLIIRIEDNGIGIPKNNQHKGRFGMLIMQERADKIPAQLTVTARKNGGTSVELLIKGSTL
ncbi:hypothetical protein J9B83_04725 [Marinomonas sp. A79]|uniref:histidine kinase n=1 Tax=Marinomonas vulgaris TaxID=2823372 RepID=A0ABS5H9T9_9GAMM|nr:ATP-binding protein [Marinomonas vulgaris]MBR7888240.1 hypothetical protein [Marinomonas vulgaris]